MILSLALKNLRAKPLRTVCAVLVIAVAVAMFFCVFSFGDAVYDYIYAVETADAGASDVLIAGKSGGNRLTSAAPLDALGDKIDYAVPTLSLYALASAPTGEQYVKLRGFEQGDWEKLQKINFAEGGAEDLSGERNANSVVISVAASQALGVGRGDRLVLNGKVFFVAAIAENDGYFVSDAPFTVIGNVDGGVDRLLGGVSVYNEIYVKAADGADVAALIDEIAALEAYDGLSVTVAADTGYVATRADGVSAPVTISGVAVIALSLIAVALIFLLSTDYKRSYAARLSVLGATKRQIVAVFSVESAVVALIGAIVGAAVAGGMFVLLLKLTLSSSLTFSVNGLYLFAASALGAVVAFAVSLYPIFRAFRDTAKENLSGVRGESGKGYLVAGVLTAVTVAALLVENLVPRAKGVLSIVNMLLVIAVIAAWAPCVVRGISALAKRSHSPAVMTAGYAALREKRTARSAQTLGVGMFVVMLLFMSWSLTTSIFTDYTTEFEDIVLVTNVPSDVDVSSFAEQSDSVREAYLMVWRQAQLSGDGFENMTMNILGSAEALDLVEFGYITPRETVKEVLSSGNFVVLDNTMAQLYGVAVGDVVTLTIDGAEHDFTVGGLVSHELFTGHYVIVSHSLLTAAYGINPDTVVLRVEGDASLAAEQIRSGFAQYNYYAVSALEAYRWDLQSLDSVFDLIGALSFILGALTFVIAAAGVVLGRTHSENTLSSLMCAGMSRRMLLASETAEQGLAGLAAFVLALPLSALGALCLVNGLQLFGLYFGYMYEAWVTVVSGVVLALMFAAVPVLFGFARRYGMRRR